MYAIIIGGTGGIGSALVDLALSKGFTVYATYRKNQHAVQVSRHTKNLSDMRQHKRLTWYALDACDEASVQQFSQHLTEQGLLKVDIFINTIGILHDTNMSTAAHLTVKKHANANIFPEKSLRDISAVMFLEVMQTNVLPTLLLAKYLKKFFKHEKNSVFATVSARVGSITDNRSGGWYSYRASKAALNMCLKNIALEWRRTMPNVCVTAIHPGTTDTKLSQPFQKNVPKDKLFTTQQTANYLWHVLENTKPEQSGCFFAWDGQEIPW